MRLPNNKLGFTIIAISYLPILFRFWYYDDFYVIGVKMITDIAFINFGWLIITGFRQGFGAWLLTPNRLMQFHNKLGIYSGILLLLHPIGVALHYGDWKILFPFIHQYGLLVSIGSVAFGLLILIIVSSITIRQTHYDIWRIVHYLPYIFFGLVFIHALTSLPLHTATGIYYMLWVILAGVATGLKILFGLKLLSFKTSIQSITQVARETYNIKFKVPPALHALWKPGQYTMLAFQRWQYNHPFSISKINHDHTAEITFKILGNFSADLAQQTVGKNLYVTGAYGSENKLFEDTDIVYIAGGIGITPYRSMIHDQLQRNTEHTIYLFYCVRSQEYLAFDDEFKKLAQQYPQFHYITISQVPHAEIIHTGYMTKEILEKYLPTVRNKYYFVCGPGPMLAHVQQLLKETGIPADRIHLESFEY